MGSGKLLIRAIKKYGIASFSKETLYIFSTVNEMNQKEKDLVTAEFVLLESNYNLCPGGHGGFGYINNNISLRIAKNKKAMATAIKNGIREKSLLGVKKFRQDPERCKIRYDKFMITMLTKYGKDVFSTFKGKRHSDETKKKMSEAHKLNRNIKERNSQFDTCWITNGMLNKKNIIWIRNRNWMV